MFRIARASALIFVLACTASAGETPNNVTGTSTQPTVPLMYEPAPGADTGEGITDYFGETFLNLFESVLVLI